MDRVWRRQIGFVFLGAAMALVGSTVVASKIIGEGMPAFSATALRFAISSPIFAVLLWLSRQKIPSLSGREWGLLLVQAAAGSVAYTVLLILALSFTSAANAGVVLGTLPVVMGVLAIAAFGERPGWRFMAAITVATVGVLLITLHLDTEGVVIPSLQDGIGIGLVLMAVVCEALFLLLNKKLAKPMPALTLSTLMSAFGLVLAIGPAGIEIASGATEHVTRAAVIGVAYYALIPTVVGFFLWYEGAARTSAGDAALFTAVLPVSALVLAALVLGEPITARQAGGCACVIVAILIGVAPRARGTRSTETPKCK
jgi:drug/metabolite transporter (DMT)-like permease